MIVSKGSGIHFVLADQRRIHLPPAVVMLHDTNGSQWSRTSFLFAPISKSGTPVRMDADAQEYLGRGYAAHEGYVNLPTRNLSRWRPLGRVRTIFYDRTGVRAQGFFKHRFSAPGMLQGAFAGAIAGGLAGLLVGAFAKSAQPIAWGVGVGAVAGAIVAKAEFPVDPPAELYQLGNRYWRLELPRLSHVSWRGFITP